MQGNVIYAYTHIMPLPQFPGFCDGFDISIFYKTPLRDQIVSRRYHEIGSWIEYSGSKISNWYWKNTLESNMYVQWHTWYLLYWAVIELPYACFLPIGTSTGFQNIDIVSLLFLGCMIIVFCVKLPNHVTNIDIHVLLCLLSYKILCSSEYTNIVCAVQLYFRERAVVGFGIICNNHNDFNGIIFWMLGFCFCIYYTSRTTRRYLLK